MITEIKLDPDVRFPIKQYSLFLRGLSQQANYTDRATTACWWS
jgi:hypothetical protein